jgi:hypothetical protein
MRLSCGILNNSGVASETMDVGYYQNGSANAKYLHLVEQIL